MLPMRLRSRGERLPDPMDMMLRSMDRFSGWPLRPGDVESDLVGSYPVDVSEENGMIKVEAELPGFNKEDIDVSIDDNVLRIEAERKTEETGATKHLSERRYTRVQRSFMLPAPVDESKADAKISDGVLYLEIPKKGEQGKKQIDIK